MACALVGAAAPRPANLPAGTLDRQRPPAAGPLAAHRPRPSRARRRGAPSDDVRRLVARPVRGGRRRDDRRAPPPRARRHRARGAGTTARGPARGAARRSRRALDGPRGARAASAGTAWAQWSLTQQLGAGVDVVEAPRSPRVRWPGTTRWSSPTARPRRSTRPRSPPFARLGAGGRHARRLARARRRGRPGCGRDRGDARGARAGRAPRRHGAGDHRRGRPGRGAVERRRGGARAPRRSRATPTARRGDRRPRPAPGASLLLGFDPAFRAGTPGAAGAAQPPAARQRRCSTIRTRVADRLAVEHEHAARGAGRSAPRPPRGRACA